MPRTARIKSVSNIYHVMLRGINRQVIFENDGDRYFFMTAMRDCKETSGFKLHAFCLMTNHIHLLIEPGNEPLDIIIKRIGGRYAGWFNRKHERIGHLFQDRFRSENVETEQYFMTVLRYILQNPMKAGMESCPGRYRWSSYLAYENGSGTITDTEFAEQVFGGRDALIRFVKQTNDDHVMDEENFDWRLRDDCAREIMTRITQCTTSSEFHQLERSVKREYIKQMYLEKLSMGQIAELTGVSKSTVHKAVQEIEPQVLTERLKLHEEETSCFEMENEVIW